jgi:hypothetical protein
MPFDVIIIRNSDGERVTYTDAGEWDTGGEYRWTEGNQACDCNRRGYFLHLLGDPDPDYGECGSTAFSVILPQEPPKELP